MNNMSVLLFLHFLISFYNFKIHTRIKVPHKTILKVPLKTICRKLCPNECISVSKFYDYSQFIDIFISLRRFNGTAPYSHLSRDQIERYSGCAAVPAVLIVLNKQALR